MSTILTPSKHACGRGRGRIRQTACEHQNYEERQIKPCRIPNNHHSVARVRSSLSEETKMSDTDMTEK